MELHTPIMADVKVCSCCKEEKSLILFNRNKAQSSGYANQCRVCKNNSRLKHINKHIEQRKLNCSNWYRNNKTYAHQLTEDWYKKHPEVRRERHMRRYSSKVKATPLWADKELILDMYKEAVYFGMQVDHIVPIRSKLVCGLHWEGNMQLLSKSDNTRKGNRFWPDMP